MIIIGVREKYLKIGENNPVTKFTKGIWNNINGINEISNNVSEKLRNNTDNKKKTFPLQLEIDKENPCCKK